MAGALNNNIIIMVFFVDDDGMSSFTPAMSLECHVLSKSSKVDPLPHRPTPRLK